MIIQSIKWSYFKRKQTYNKLYSSHDFHLKDTRDNRAYKKLIDEKYFKIENFKKNRDRTFLHMMILIWIWF